jgi:hypothetical protein
MADCAVCLTHPFTLSSPCPVVLVVLLPRHTTHTQGVSENIMLGQLCPLGTGAFDLLLNEEELASAVDLLADDDDYEYGDSFMTPGRMTPGHMTPSRTPHYTPNRCGAGRVCAALRVALGRPVHEQAASCTCCVLLVCAGWGWAGLKAVSLSVCGVSAACCIMFLFAGTRTRWRIRCTSHRCGTSRSAPCAAHP